MIVREQVAESLHRAAETKTATAVGVGGASAFAWIEKLSTDPIVAGVGTLLGLLVALSIVVLNIQNFRLRAQQTRRRSELSSREDHKHALEMALLKRKALDLGIDPEKV